MTGVTNANAAAMITRDEGLNLCLYDDATGRAITRGSTVLGHPTIGYGTNLDEPITEKIAAYLAEYRIKRIVDQLSTHTFFVGLISPIRQAVIIDMAYNLGVSGLLDFHKMIAAISKNYYTIAAAEIMDSKAAHELPNRYTRLANSMRFNRV